MAHLLGPTAARVMSAVMLLLFISAISAMMLVGPRVYAAMSRDGMLPAFLTPRPKQPPTAAVVLQGALALVLLVTHDLREVLSNVGAIVVLFAALTVAGLFRAFARATTPEEKPSVASLVAATVYVASAGWMLYRGFSRAAVSLVAGDWKGASSLLWVLAVSAVALVGWYVASRRVTKA
jgi:APA family basic amino acid/polyamine antiporter